MNMFGRKRKSEKFPPWLDQDYEYDPEIEDLENSFEFQLPEEADNLRRAWEHKQAGGVFAVRKSFRSKGMKNRVVAELSYFPSAADVEDIVEERYGGGIYTIHPGRSPKVLKTYELSGKSKFLVNGPKPKTSTQIFKETLDEIMGQEILDRIREDPEFAKQILMARLQQELGITFPTQEERDKEAAEKRFFEQLKRYPDLQNRWFEAKLKQEYGIEAKKITSPLEELEQNLQILARLREAIDGSRDDSLKPLLREVARGLLDTAPIWIPLIPQIGASIAGLQGRAESGTLELPRVPAPSESPGSSPTPDHGAGE